MKYWTTQKGKKLEIKKMKNIHLKNCIQMLEEKFKIYKEARKVFFRDIGFSGKVISDVQYLSYKSVNEMFPIIKDLRIELSGREK